MLKLSKNDYKKKSKDEIIEELFEIYKKYEKTQKELKKYKNANTPSSVNKHLKANTQGIKAKDGVGRGAPKGHRGATLKLGAPEVSEHVTRCTCPDCYTSDIRHTGHIKVKKVICYQKAKTYVKEYKQYEYVCIPERKLFFAHHKDIPSKGIYDKSIQALVNYYKFKLRLPHELVVDAMNNIHDTPMTPPTSLAITRRASNKLEPLYNDLEKQVQQQTVINGDETSMSVQGENHWIWVFCNTLISLFKFKKKRGGDIVEKTLGKNFQGKLISDGWATYKVYCEKNKIKLQRCWDHLRRETKFECQKKHPDLYKWCCDIYFMVKKGKEYKQEKRRQEIYEKCVQEMSRLITYMKVHKNLRKLAKKMKNGKDYWFTCILHPELPMTNNEAERSLRPFVVIRKIIGCLRSDLGPRNYEVMMSLISTWHKQGKNVFSMLETTL